MNIALRKHRGQVQDTANQQIIIKQSLLQSNIEELGKKLSEVEDAIIASKGAVAEKKNQMVEALSGEINVVQQKLKDIVEKTGTETLLSADTTAA